MRSVYLCALIAPLLFIATIETGTGLRLPSKAAEVANVSERELRQLFPGKFRAIAHGLIKVSITALADGSLIAQRLGKSDSGSWNIRSGQLCIKFSKWLKGRTRCSTVTERAGWYRTSDVAFRKIDGIALALP